VSPTQLTGQNQVKSNSINKADDERIGRPCHRRQTCDEIGVFPVKNTICSTWKNGFCRWRNQGNSDIGKDGAAWKRIQRCSSRIREPALEYLVERSYYKNWKCSRSDLKHWDL